MAQQLSNISTTASPCRSAFQASEALAEALAGIAITQNVISGESIFSVGQQATGVFLVRTGTVRAYLNTGDGREVVNRILGPGALLGVPAAMCSKQYAFSVESLDDSTLVGFVETSALNDFLRNRPDLCMQVVLMMSDELIELRQSRDHMKSCNHTECSLYESCRHCN